MKNETREQIESILGEVDSYKLGDKLKLRVPIEWGSKGKITELEVKNELKMKHLKGKNFKDLSTTEIIQLSAHIFDMPVAFIEEMSPKDLLLLIEAVNSFF